MQNKVEYNIYSSKTMTLIFNLIKNKFGLKNYLNLISVIAAGIFIFTQISPMIFNIVVTFIGMFFVWYIVEISKGDVKNLTGKNISSYIELSLILIIVLIFMSVSNIVIRYQSYDQLSTEMFFGLLLIDCFYNGIVIYSIFKTYFIIGRIFRLKLEKLNEDLSNIELTAYDRFFIQIGMYTVSPINNMINFINGDKKIIFSKYLQRHGVIYPLGHSIEIKEDSTVNWKIIKILDPEGFEKETIPESEEFNFKGIEKKFLEKGYIEVYSGNTKPEQSREKVKKPSLSLFNDDLTQEVCEKYFEGLTIEEVFAFLDDNVFDSDLMYDEYYSQVLKKKTYKSDALQDFRDEISSRKTAEMVIVYELLYRVPEFLPNKILNRFEEFWYEYGLNTIPVLYFSDVIMEKIKFILIIKNIENINIITKIEKTA